MGAVSGGPLDGLRVIELAGMGPAPFAALILAELGASVIRIERPRIDGVDGVGGVGGGIAGSVTGGLNRSRPNVAVDLRQARGRDVARRLIDAADVLIEGMRPGVTERLGLGPQDCLTRNPRLVYGRMTGWGQDGPLAARAGHDITYAALTGALHLVGGPDRPIPPANVLADFGGGTLYLLVGVLAALHARQRTGRGQVVDAAMVDGGASLITMIYAMFGAGQWRDERGVNPLDGGQPFYDTYRCADGKFVAVGALEPQFYAQLLTGLGLAFSEDQHDRSAWPAHRAAFERVFASRTRDEWAAVFEGTDACVAPVLSLAEAPRHPHAVARGIFTTVAGVVQPTVAPRFSGTPALAPTPERANGADTRDVLRANGFTDDELDSLIADAVIHQAPRERSPA